MPMSRRTNSLAFKVALAIAEEEKLVSPAELDGQMGSSEDDIKRSHKNVKSAIDKLRGTQKVDYSLWNQDKGWKRFDVPTAQAIIGILYARGEFVEVIDSLDYVPGEVKDTLKRQKYYRPVRVDRNNTFPGNICRAAIIS